MKTRPVQAWAAVGIKSDKVLRGLDGNYSIYTHRVEAEKDRTSYSEVRRVEIRVLPRLKGDDA